MNSLTKGQRMRNVVALLMKLACLKVVFWGPVKQLSWLRHFVSEHLHQIPYTLFCCGNFWLFENWERFSWLIFLDWRQNLEKLSWLGCDFCINGFPELCKDLFEGLFFDKFIFLKNGALNELSDWFSGCFLWIQSCKKLVVVFCESVKSQILFDLDLKFFS